jgi:hypothetical protein
MRLGLRVVAVGLVASLAGAADLENDLGRSEVRIRSAPYPLVAGRTVHESALPRRLERLGYRRVHQKPDEPGGYFYGHEVFWIYRHAHRWNGTDHPASLIGLKLRREDGRILGAVGEGDNVLTLEEGDLWLEPETLSESLSGDRADRVLVRFDGLDVAAKTGTSSGLRDAWLAGEAGSVVTVVWVGLDDGGSLGLTGAKAAGPVWKAFMEAAVTARPELRRRAPEGIVEAWVDPESGLRVGRGKRGAEEEIFRRGELPPHDRFWRRDRAVPIIY